MELNASVDASKATRKVNKLSRDLSKTKEILMAIQHKMLWWINENFEKEGIESKWPQLSPWTIYVRQKRHARTMGPKGGAKRGIIAGGRFSLYSRLNILRDTGYMSQSYQPGKPDSSTSIKGNLLVVGTSDRKAPVHEYGDSSRRIPQRKMLPSKDLAISLAEATYTAYVEKVVSEINSGKT